MAADETSDSATMPRLRRIDGDLVQRSSRLSRVARWSVTDVDAARADPELLLRDPPLVIRGAVEEGLDVPAERELLRQLRRLVELGAQPLGLGEVVVAESRLDVELGILLRERPHPLLDLPAAVLVTRS